MPNIPVYIIGALLLALTAMAVAYKTQSTRLELKTSQYEKLVAETKSQGAISQLKQNELKAAYLAIANQLEQTREQARKDTDTAYANYERLRREAGASSSRVRSLTEALQGIDCGPDEARFSRNLEQFERGAIARLVKSRDEIIIDLNSCKAYVQQVTEASKKR